MDIFVARLNTAFGGFLSRRIRFLLFVHCENRGDRSSTYMMPLSKIMESIVSDSSPYQGKGRKRKISTAELVKRSKTTRLKQEY
jgi:hypothetical protein